MISLQKLKGSVLLGACLSFQVSVFGQESGLSTLSHKVEAYAHKAPQEKLFVHTDKSFYLAGETAWFKVYSIDAKAHTELDLSKVAYLEILDKEHVPVLQTKVALSDGKGSGSLLVPASLNSGNYVIRAYTNWMKNFGAALYFEKPVTIVNTFKKLALEPEDYAVTYDVQFLPEGGHLVNGLQSKVAFKAVDKNGKGVDFDGAVLNQKSDTVAHFKTHKFGMGQFLMTPKEGDVYRAILKGSNGQIITRSLPAAEKEGIVMSLAEKDANYLKVTVHTNAVQASMLAVPYVYLLAHTRQEAKVAETLQFDKEGKASFLIDKNKLGDGISHFTIFNSAQKPVCQRLYFKRPEHVLQIETKTANWQHSTRSEVNLDFLTRNLDGKPVAADMSVAVYRLDSLVRPEQQAFLSYLWLTSELKGTIESPEYYFTHTGTDATMALENLMLTHGWSRFSWEDVLGENELRFRYAPEYGGHIVQAKVLHKGTGEPASNVTAYLASPSRTIRLNSARSDEAGNLIFEVKDFYGPRDLILQAGSQERGEYRFQVSSPFSVEQPARQLATFELSEKLQQKLQDNSIHLQVRNYHLPAAAFQVKDPSLDSIAFYGQPDRSFKLDDYTRFPVMEEVMREYVQPVMVRKRGGKFHFLVIDQPRKEAFRNDPLILLDGVPIPDTDQIMAYDPRKVERLDVMSRRYTLGPSTFEGIVSYVTYDGNMKDFQLDPRALLMEYEGMQLQREFYSPQYETQEQLESRIPDLRTLLHWVPSLKTDGEGKRSLRFYSSDQQGTYVVVVHGITKDGKAGSSTYTFEVKQQVL